MPSFSNRKLLKQLKKRCRADIETFAKLGDTIQTPDGPLTYIDNGGDCLAVAHLDWVLWQEPEIYRKEGLILCPQLDDRLGVWTILDVLPMLGVKVDVLLTDSEEVGRSTAQYFKSPKAYNWMFQFDRRGTDSVLYEYDSPENRNRLEAHGLECGQGSFSDICYLDHMGVSGWNIGTGYHNEHSTRCYADLADTLGNAFRFSRFWMEHHTTRIEAPPKPVYKSLWPSRWDNLPSASRYASQWDDDDTQLASDDYQGSGRFPDWVCRCGLDNRWDMVYCHDCGSCYDDSPLPPLLDSDLYVDDLQEDNIRLQDFLRKMH